MILPLITAKEHRIIIASQRIHRFARATCGMSEMRLVLLQRYAVAIIGGLKHEAIRRQLRESKNYCAEHDQFGQHGSIPETQVQ